MTKIGNLAKILALVTTISCFGSDYQENRSNDKTVSEIREGIYRNQGYSKVEGFERKNGVKLYLKSPDKNVEDLVSLALSDIPRVLKDKVVSVRVDSKSNMAWMGGSTDGIGIELHGTNGLAGNLAHEMGHSWLISQSNEKRDQVASRWKEISNFEYGEKHTVNGRKWKDSPSYSLEATLEKIGLETSRLEGVKMAISQKYASVIKTGVATDEETLNSYNREVKKFEEERVKLKEIISDYNSKAREVIKGSSPRQGIVSPYASTSLEEDICEDLRYLFTQPCEARDLMKDEDTRYRQKFEYLSNEIGFGLNEAQ